MLSPFPLSAVRAAPVATSEASRDDPSGGEASGYRCRLHGGVRARARRAPRVPEDAPG